MAEKAKTKDTKRVAHLAIENCMDCPHHEVVSDPDPYDSFCSDDLAVVCKKSPLKANVKSNHLADHVSFKKSAVGCRPYNLRKEAEIPSWCPLLSL